MGWCCCNMALCVGSTSAPAAWPPARQARLEHAGTCGAAARSHAPTTLGAAAHRTITGPRCFDNAASDPPELPYITLQSIASPLHYWGAEGQARGPVHAAGWRGGHEASSPALLGWRDGRLRHGTPKCPKTQKALCVSNPDWGLTRLKPREQSGGTADSWAAGAELLWGQGWVCRG